MAARMALEAAVMEAEPPPYPMSGREQEGYAKRPWGLGRCGVSHDLSLLKTCER